MNFKQIEGFPNYLIYEDGRVWSMNSNSIKKAFLSKKRYWNIGLSHKGKESKFLVHRLLAIHFIPNPENKPVVDHKDGVTTNNSLSNLRWVTHRENCNNRLLTTGVCYEKRCINKCWVCQWTVNGKRHRKSFATRDEAISHRQSMVDIHYERPIIKKNN